MDQVLVGDVTDWGVDFTFDCTGNTEVMRAALQSAHRFDFFPQQLLSACSFFIYLFFFGRGWGESCVIGVAAAGKEISTRCARL